MLNPKSTAEKEAQKADKQLRQLKKSIERDKKLLRTLEHECHADGARYTNQDCVAYAFLYSVKQRYNSDGVEFDTDTAKWLLDKYCGGSDTYNPLFLFKFMMACANEER